MLVCLAGDLLGGASEKIRQIQPNHIIDMVIEAISLPIKFLSGWISALGMWWLC